MLQFYHKPVKGATLCASQNLYTQVLQTWQTKHLQTAHHSYSFKPYIK